MKNSKDFFFFIFLLNQVSSVILLLHGEKCRKNYASFWLVPGHIRIFTRFLLHRSEKSVQSLSKNLDAQFHLFAHLLAIAGLLHSSTRINFFH